MAITMTRVHHEVGLKSIKLMCVCVCRAAHNDDASPAQCPHSAVHIERQGRQARDPARAVMFGLAVPICGGWGGYGSWWIVADTGHGGLWRIPLNTKHGAGAVGAGGLWRRAGWRTSSSGVWATQGLLALSGH